MDRVSLIIEAIQKRDSTTSKHELSTSVLQYFHSSRKITPNTVVSNQPFAELDEIYVCETNREDLNYGLTLPSKDKRFLLTCYIYKLQDQLEPRISPLLNTLRHEDALQCWRMPSEDFNHIWNKLVYNNGYLKTFLLNKLKESLCGFETDPADKLYVLRGSSSNGKSSLCTALAQKLSIHLNTFDVRFGVVKFKKCFARWKQNDLSYINTFLNKLTQLVKANINVVLVLLLDDLEWLSIVKKIGVKNMSLIVDSLLVSLKHHPRVAVFCTTTYSGDFDNDTTVVDITSLTWCNVYKLYWDKVARLLRDKKMKGDLRQFLPPHSLNRDIDDIHDNTKRLIVCSKLTTGLSCKQITLLADNAEKTLNNYHPNSLSVQHYLELIYAEIVSLSSEYE